MSDNSDKTNSFPDGDVVVLQISELLKIKDFPAKIDYSEATTATAKEQITEIANYANSMGYMLTMAYQSRDSIVVFTKKPH